LVPIHKGEQSLIAFIVTGVAASGIAGIAIGRNRFDGKVKVFAVDDGFNQ
jgi:hypothetical protein